MHKITHFLRLYFARIFLQYLIFIFMRLFIVEISFEALFASRGPKINLLILYVQNEQYYLPNMFVLLRPESF